MDKKSIVIVTLATNERFLQGAYNLYKSYLKINSKYPFYCMIWKETNTTNFPNLPTIIIPKTIPKWRRDIYCQQGIGVFGKLALWSLENFDYVLYLDSDIILYKNFDTILEEYIKEDNYDAIMPKMYNVTSFHDYFSGGAIFLKPNKKIFAKTFNYINLSVNDQEVFTFMYDNYDINIIIKDNFFNNFFHFDDPYKGKKYWETTLGNDIYNLILEKPEMAETIKQLQFKNKKSMQNIEFQN